jgi:hypothetical protein
MKHRKSDILWKTIIEEVFADLLRFIYPDADQKYDMDRGFEFLDKELAELHMEPDQEKDSRFADKLVKVYRRDGFEQWLLLHIEVQGDTSDRDAFAERMFTYFYRIRDHYPGKKVAAVAIFTGEDGERMPGQFTYEYEDTQLIYRYRTVAIKSFADEELESSPNPFAQVIIAARLRLLEETVPEDQLLYFKVLAAKKLFKKGFEARKVRAILNFLRNYVLFEKPETIRNFDNSIEQSYKYYDMNTDELIKIIEREELARNLLEDRTLNLSVEKIAALTSVPVKDVKEIKEELGIH